MRRTSRVVAFIVLFLVSNQTVRGQRIAMLDIKGHQDSFIQRFKTKKGFYEYGSWEGKPRLRGKIKDDSVNLLLYVSPHTKRVYQVDVQFESFSKWRKAKKFYENHLEAYKLKYGTVAVSKRRFEKPFCDGGGKEFEAIRLGKAEFSDDWGDMPYIQNLHLTYFISGNGSPTLRYVLKDEFMKYEEEKKLTPPSLF